MRIPRAAGSASPNAVVCTSYCTVSVKFSRGLACEIRFFMHIFNFFDQSICLDMYTFEWLIISYSVYFCLYLNLSIYVCCAALALYA